MKSIIRVAGLLVLVATIGCAKTWSGVLVDAKCYAGWRGDTRSSLQYVDRDMSWIIQYCAPRLNTKSFAVVPLDGRTFPLDSQGNAQASALVRKAGKRPLLWVQVVGEKPGRDVRVNRVRVTRVLRRKDFFPA
jgi:hypothetical protein